MLAVSMEIMPVQKDSKEEMFADLCKDFVIDGRVAKLIMDSPIENLEDFATIS